MSTPSPVNITKASWVLGPCQAHHCRKCCIETEMTLSYDDIARIKAAGHTDFYHEVEGYLQLKNTDEGICYFLGPDSCRIYESRPDGCKLYPLILDIDTNTITFHDYCPYTDEFTFDVLKAHLLRELIELEERERSERLKRPITKEG